MQVILFMTHYFLYIEITYYFYLKYMFIYFILFILLFKGLHLFEPDFFLFQNTHTFLYLSRDKTKG